MLSGCFHQNKNIAGILSSVEWISRVESHEFDRSNGFEILTINFDVHFGRISGCFGIIYSIFFELYVHFNKHNIKYKSITEYF